jgi:pyridoxamine 5'-phosphate oxidase
MMILAHLRRAYTLALGALRERDVDPDPIRQFERWFEQTLKAKVPEPNAMTLATVTPEGAPDARVVLLKAVEPEGFVFYTNYESVKGRQLAANPRATLVFLWLALARQVRIDGVVEKVSPEESEQYFHARPRDSQLGAWASHQSQVVPTREALEERFEEVKARFAGQEVPLPPFWGGYRLKPHTIEFWQGRPSRLHDRLRYTRLAEGGWRIERLSP